jgi:hypothetical protein
MREPRHFSAVAYDGFMIDVEVTRGSNLVPTLDLSRVPLDQRASVWSAHAARFFPGAAIRDLPQQPTLGQVARVPVGHGTLWYIHSPPALLQYRPPPVTCFAPGLLPSFGLVAQLNGVLAASQSGRDCALEPGDLCFLDACEAFTLGGAGPSELIVLEMPRDGVTGTHPFLGSHTACALKDGSPGARLLRNTVLGLAGAAAYLSQSQRAAALVGVLGMLGVLDQAHTPQIPVDRPVKT